MQIIRGIILRGASIGDLWNPIAWLSLYTVVILALAVASVQEDGGVKSGASQETGEKVDSRGEVS